jgi:hypothetical protein
MIDDSMCLLSNNGLRFLQYLFYQAFYLIMLSVAEVM